MRLDPPFRQHFHLSSTAAAPPLQLIFRIAEVAIAPPVPHHLETLMSDNIKLVIG